MQQLSSENVKVPNRIRELRRKLKITQVQLAAMLCTDQSLVSKWERGLHTPTRNTRTRIASALRVRVEALEAV
jgi:transcriptional regulator with XRE-family HTH domain